MKKLDVTGEICPRPALLVRRELAELEPGDELIVKGDYPPAEQNLRRTCKVHGFSVDSIEESDEASFTLRITVTESSVIPEA